MMKFAWTQSAWLASVLSASSFSSASSRNFLASSTVGEAANATGIKSSRSFRINPIVVHSGPPQEGLP